MGGTTPGSRSPFWMRRERSFMTAASPRRPDSMSFSFASSGETTWSGLLPPIFRDGCSCACSPIGSKPRHSGISTGRFCDVCTSTGTKPSSRGTLVPLQPADRRHARASGSNPELCWSANGTAVSSGHDPRRRVRLERLRLPQPFAGRQGDHRHELERTPLLRVEGGQDRRPQQKKKRHPKTGLIARYCRVANPRRVRPRNARSFAASRNQGVRFGISERIGLATQLRGRANGPSDRLAQGPAFRPQGVPARSSSRPGGPTMKRVERKIALRCAVYTRVSTDSGLEQDFNSLDNQREASEAYIKSQAHEGWKLVRERYDDGGFSGGSMERPALQKLLDDVRARKIDVIVVYKVDRLTRSLADFAKLVELFDAHGVSFISVTQAFNTTPSMRRLTLNMLSLAFMSPALAEAAMEGRLPRGFCVKRLTDLPMLWSEQWRDLGLQELIEGEPGAKVRMRTPDQAIGVRGTTVWGGPIDKGFGVLALSGEVTVTGRRGTVTLKQGEGTMLFADGKPRRVVTWPGAKVQRAIATIAFGNPPGGH